MGALEEQTPPKIWSIAVGKVEAGEGAEKSMKGTCLRLGKVSIGQSAIRCMAPAQNSSQIAPIWDAHDVLGTHSQFNRFSMLTSTVRENGSNGAKLRYMLQNMHRLGIFDLGFDFHAGKDVQLFVELVRWGENLGAIKGMGSLMRRVAQSSHRGCGVGLEVIKNCGLSSQATEHTFKVLYSTKMRQLTIDILVERDPMECVKFLAWYKDCEDFDASFHAFAKFKLVQQQAQAKFSLPVQINDTDVKLLLQHHLGSYLTFLMGQSASVYSPKEKFDKFLAIYFKSIEKFNLSHREIHKCNSQFLHFLVKNYDIEYKVLLAYTLSLFPSATNYEILKSLDLIDSVSSHSVLVEQLPTVEVNDKIANTACTIYLSDINLLYSQLLAHQHLNSQDTRRLFNHYMDAKTGASDQPRGNNHPFVKHNSSVLVTFLKYCKFELNDLQLALEILISYIERLGFSEFKHDMSINKSYKHVISLLLARLCEVKLDRVSAFEAKYDMVWDWQFYWSLITNAIKMSELGYANKVWDKVKTHPELWPQITKNQAAVLLDLNFTFNQDVVRAIHEAKPAKPFMDPVNYLTDKLSPDEIIKSLSDDI